MNVNAPAGVQGVAGNEEGQRSNQASDKPARGGQRIRPHAGRPGRDTTMFYHNPAKPASPAQRQLLRELGISIPADLNSYRADRLIKAHFKQWSALPATPKQEALLRVQGRWIDGLTR